MPIGVSGKRISQRLNGLTALQCAAFVLVVLATASVIAAPMLLLFSPMAVSAHTRTPAGIPRLGDVENADVAAVENRVEDPPFSAGLVFYGLGAGNFGPNRADDVTFRDPLPVGTVFDRIEVRSSGGELMDVPVSTPAVGETGEIVCRLGAIDPDDYVNVFIWLTVVAEPGTILINTAEAQSATPDSDPENNTLTINLPVPFPAVVESIKALQEEGRPFRIRINGSNFESTSGYYPAITIGSESLYWEKRRVTADRIILKGGDKLKRLFPRGVAVPIVIVSASGAQVTVWFAR